MRDLPVWKTTAGVRLIAVGGSAVTLAALRARHKRLHPAKLHGRSLNQRWLLSTARRLSAMSTEEIARLIPFDPKRSRVITAGTFLWAAVCNRFDAERMTISARGLRWGVADQLAGSNRL
jgi:exopolyphosphatase/guanosine-5'-triphosphate,3'-diphosphate pyrophosphatase